MSKLFDFVVKKGNKYQDLLEDSCWTYSMCWQYPLAQNQEFISPSINRFYELVSAISLAYCGNSHICLNPLFIFLAFSLCLVQCLESSFLFTKQCIVCSLFYCQEEKLAWTAKTIKPQFLPHAQTLS